jgi:hypothetical protein
MDLCFDDEKHAILIVAARRVERWWIRMRNVHRDEPRPRVARRATTVHPTAQRLWAPVSHDRPTVRRTAREGKETSVSRAPTALLKAFALCSSAVPLPHERGAWTTNSLVPLIPSRPCSARAPRRRHLCNTPAAEILPVCAISCKSPRGTCIGETEQDVTNHSTTATETKDEEPDLGSCTTIPTAHVSDKEPPNVANGRTKWCQPASMLQPLFPPSEEDYRVCLALSAEVTRPYRAQVDAGNRIPHPTTVATPPSPRQLMTSSRHFSSSRYEVGFQRSKRQAADRLEADLAAKRAAILQQRNHHDAVSSVKNQNNAVLAQFKMVSHHRRDSASSH